MEGTGLAEQVAEVVAIEGILPFLGEVALGNAAWGVVLEPCVASSVGVAVWGNPYLYLLLLGLHRLSSNFHLSSEDFLSFHLSVLHLFLHRLLVLAT